MQVEEIELRQKPSGRYLFRVGEIDRVKNIVTDWDNVEGFWCARRGAKVKRAEPKKDDPWTDKDEVSLEQLEERLYKLEQLDTTGKAQHIVAKYEAEEAEVRAKIDELLEKRTMRTAWEELMIERCLKGHGSLTGRHFFYFNFCHMQTQEKNTTYTHLPDYRQCDDWLSRIIDQVTEESTGICLVKRRRIGLTWGMIGMSILYDMIFFNGNIFFSSHSEADIEKFGDRVQFVYDRLPRFLKGSHKMGTRNSNGQKVQARREKVFYPNELVFKLTNKDKNLKIEDVTLPRLRTATPENEKNFAGDGVSKMIFDECGEIDNLETVLQWGKPMLAGSDGLQRSGSLLLFGTVGNMMTAGATFQRVFHDAKIHEVHPIFMPGWMGLKLDKFGNDRKDAAINYILEKRQPLIDANKVDELATMKQKYPLKISDAFSMNNSRSALPLDLVQAMISDHKNNRPTFQHGIFVRSQNGSVRLHPQPQNGGTIDEKEWHGYGQVCMVEPYIPTTYNHPYVIGVDPIDIDKSESMKRKDKRYRGSDISFVVFKRITTTGGLGWCPVCYYHGRPDKSEDAFLQLYLASKFYGDAPINIERQKGDACFRFISIKMGEPELIAYSPGALMGLTNSLGDWGYHNNPKWWNQMLAEYRQYLIQFHDNPHHMRLLMECFMLDHQQGKCDMSVAFLSALMLALEINARIAAGRQEEEVISETEANEFSRNGWRKVDGKFKNFSQLSPGMRDLLG